MVDVGPGEPSASPIRRPRVGEELEPAAVPAGVIEEPAELVEFEAGALLGRPAGLLAGFEITDGIRGEPAGGGREGMSSIID